MILNWQIPLTEPRIVGDLLAFDVDHSQQLQSRLVLVGFADDPDLGYLRFDFTGVSCAQMLTGHFPIPRSPQRLAVKRQCLDLANP